MRSLALALLLLATLAPAARSQGGVNLYWDDCSVAGSRLKTFACNTNTGPPFEMFVSVKVPADMPQFFAAAITVDAMFRTVSVLPAWWLTNVAECRAGAIRYVAAPESLSTASCPSIWGAAPTISVFTTQPYVLGPGMVRLNAGTAVPVGSEQNLVADGTELVVAKFAISRAKTVGTGACTGCATPVDFVIASVLLQQPGGMGNYTLTTPDRSSEIWFNESVTPAQNRTWGQVKSLFR